MQLYTTLLLAVLRTLYLAFQSVKLGLCSSEWDHAWNVDYWLHALDHNGEFSKYTHPVCKNNDVMCEKLNLPVQRWQKLSINGLPLLRYACNKNLSF